MPLIYEPNGKAREYSPLALNTYRNCDHRCGYCYCQAFQAGFFGDVIPRDLGGLEREAEKANRQILLCFMGDPYCHQEAHARNTRKALEILRRYRCSVAILSKGGTRSLADLDLLTSWPEGRIKLGATLTFVTPEKSKRHEPGAAMPIDRLAALEKAHNAGIKTWASIEPVLDPAESLAVIQASLPFVDQYKVGKLNHAESKVDWTRFLVNAATILREAKKPFYVKFDLRVYAPPGFLNVDECDEKMLFLPDRPEATQSTLF